MITRRFQSIFRPQSGALAFFISIVFWGIAVGSFAAGINNFLHEIYGIGKLDRGIIEFFREMPGVFLVVLLALLHRVSDWQIMRLGALIAMVGVAALCIPANKALITLFIVIWSTGEHLVMPIRHSIAMQVAQKGKEGLSLGFTSAVMHVGTVAGSLLVAGIFWIGTHWLECQNPRLLFNILWVFIGILMLTSFISTFTEYAPKSQSKRPKLYFHRKFNIFYLLELFYGARKQVFMTFAPYVLVVIYKLNTSQVAMLIGLSGALNIAFAPLIGRICDKVGYRNVMIYDTVILFFVCLFYGYANTWFSPSVAVVIVCINYLLDAIISTTSMAANLYVKDIGGSKDEITATLSTGISINHVISIGAAWAGGWCWEHWGVETLFIFAAAMAIANTLCAMAIPKKQPGIQEQAP